MATMLRRRGRGPERLTPTEMTVVEHLTELRNRLIKSVLAIVAGGIIAFVVYPQILDVLVEPYCDVLRERADRTDCALIFTSPAEGLGVRLRVAGYGGVVIALPVVLWQLWRFITPGLHPHEKRYAVPFVLSSVVLFLLGAGLALWSVPRALDFLIGVGGPSLSPLLQADNYLQFVTFMMLAFGAGFLFPILLVFLQLAGVLSNARLRSWRRPAIVSIVALVAVITPSGDPYTLGALSVPMYAFYEASILVGRLIDRRRTRSSAGA